MKGKMPAMIVLSALLMVCAAGAQQAPPSKTEPAKPKAKRVWTNEDVGTLRKPVDEFEDAKRKQAEEEAAKQKADATKPAQQTPGEKPAPKPEDFLPKTVEEAEKTLAAKQYEIEMQYEAIELVKKEQAQATTDESRAAFQKRIDTLTATLEEAIGEMRAVDARMKELKSKPPAPPKPAAPKSEAPKPETPNPPAALQQI